MLPHIVHQLNSNEKAVRVFSFRYLDFTAREIVSIL